jgi:uncharacterized protein YlxP (DUF503 family)
LVTVELLNKFVEQMLTASEIGSNDSFTRQSGFALVSSESTKAKCSLSIVSAFLFFKNKTENYQKSFICMRLGYFNL